VAAFTPSAMSLVGDATRPEAAGRAYAWYATAHYGAIGVRPFLGGLAAEWWSYTGAFVVSAAGAAIACALGLAIPVRSVRATSAPRVTFRNVRSNASVWVGWIVAASGLLTQGAVFTFFPLLGDARGLSPAAIGLVFLVLGVANSGTHSRRVAFGSHGTGRRVTPSPACSRAASRPRYCLTSWAATAQRFT
jgi:predicted MFS family arabinose efflux permease